MALKKQLQNGLNKVMGWLIPQVRGRADGRLVNEVARELLAHGGQ